MANSKSKAGQFADRIEALGYAVQRKKVSRHEKQVLATLKDITIIATWVDDKLAAPVDFVRGERTDKIRKVKDARLHAMALAAEALAVPEPPKAKAAKPTPTPEPAVERPDADEEYLAKVRGATILWELNGHERKTKIEKAPRHLKVEYSKTGERYLTFCGDDGFHTRPTARITII